MVKVDYVLIIDSKDRRERVKASVESAIPNGTVLVLRSAKPTQSEHAVSNKCMVAFVHTNDLSGENKELDIVQSVKDEIQSSEVVIAYTGSVGGVDSRSIRLIASAWGFSNSGKWFGVNKKIVKADFDTEGMKEVAEWAVNCDRNYESLPRLLRHDAPQYLHSLRAMLEIFLSANVDRVPLDGVRAKLGLSEAGSKPVVVKEKVRDLINSLATWRMVFQGNLIMHAKNEWTGRGDFLKLENLLQKFDPPNSRTLSIEEAAEAYECLAKELER